MIDSGSSLPASRCHATPGRSTLAELREAFGPESYYWRINTAADAWDDWRAYRATEPGGTLRAYARLLLHHEARRWGTPPLPLMRRLVDFLRRHEDIRAVGGPANTSSRTGMQIRQHR